MRKIIDFHTHPFYRDTENTCFYKESLPLEKDIFERDLKTAGISHIFERTESMKEQNYHVHSSQDEKYMHISFDDVYLCLYDIITHNYSSIFENIFLSSLKDLHDTYGAVFTLMCFNSHTIEKGYHITAFPRQYAGELKSCSHWLKFAFHAENETTKYTEDCIEEIKASYNQFLKAILRAAETADSIDTVTRLGFFTGTLADIQAIKECEHGITGLLTADDMRISYYFTEEFNKRIIAETILYDSENDIKLIRSQKRLESILYPISALEEFLSCDKKIIEIFTHEALYNGTVSENMKLYIKWAAYHNYKFGYVQNIL